MPNPKSLTQPGTLRTPVCDEAILDACAVRFLKTMILCPVIIA